MFLDKIQRVQQFITYNELKIKVFDTFFGLDYKMQNLNSSYTTKKKIMKFLVNIGNMWRFMQFKAQIIV